MDEEKTKSLIVNDHVRTVSIRTSTVLATGMDALWIMAANALDGGDHQEHCMCHRGDEQSRSRAEQTAEQKQHSQI